MKKNLNINVNKDDFALNDYLFAWEQFGERPSKIIFYEPIEFQAFQSFISNYTSTELCTLIEVFPVGDTGVKNKKVTLKLDENVLLSYTHFDSETEDDDNNLITELTIFYCNKSKEFVDDFISKFEDLLNTYEEYTDDNQSSNTFSLTLGTSGLELNSVKFLEIDQENIDLYYNDKTFKQVNKLSKSLKKVSKGLSIIHGHRGTGKSSLVNYLSTKIEKPFIFIPCPLFDTIVLSPEFKTFLNKNKDSVIILDDADIYFSELYSKSNIFTNNITQLVDGLDSDDYRVQIIAILNLKEVDQIDHILLQCNNLIDVICLDSLESSKVKDLCKHLNIKNKFTSPTNIRNIIHKRQDYVDTKDIGFI
jgi:hypothetical protein